MEKIKFITDSSSDISKKLALEYDIEVVPIGISMQGKAYKEGVDFTNEEFYKIVEMANPLPTTSAINPEEWYDIFEEYAKEDYDRLVVVTLASKLSSTHHSAKMAAEAIMSDYNIKIDVFDSKTCSAGYGYPLTVAAKMHSAGHSFLEIRDYFEDWFNSFEVYFLAFSFDIVKKSGRVNAASAFIGEKLGIIPIMQQSDGEFRSYDRARGEKNVIAKLINIAKKRMRPGSPYLLLNGTQPNVCDNIISAFTNEFAEAPVAVYQPGPSMVVNAGPKMLCIGFLGEKR